MARTKPTKKIRAWMVMSKHGHPVQENHPWGWNFIVAKTKGEATIWNSGERAVKVIITVCDGDKHE